MKFKNIIFYNIPGLVLINALLGAEFKIQHPHETLKAAQQFESLKILIDAGYKISDGQIREHIKTIHKTAPNAYRHFCNTLHNNRSSVLDSLTASLSEYIKTKKTEHPHLLVPSFIQPDVPENKKREIVGVAALATTTQHIVNSYLADHNSIMPQKICLSYDDSTEMEHYCSSADKEAEIRIEKQTDPEVEAFTICHELSHAGDRDSCRLHYACGILGKIEEFESAKQALEIKIKASQPKSWGDFFFSLFSRIKSPENKALNNVIKLLATNTQLSEIEKKIQLSRHSNELIADALASNSNKKMCRTGSNFFGIHSLDEASTHPACAVRMHQMSLLHRYYKIEQKMCREYGFMGYKHGNLFN